MGKILQPNACMHRIYVTHIIHQKMFHLQITVGTLNVYLTHFGSVTLEI